MISVFLSLLRFVLWPISYDPAWMFYVHLRRMCVLLLLDGIFYMCLLNPFVLRCGSSPTFLCWFSVKTIYPLLIVGYWNSCSYCIVVYLFLNIYYYILVYFSDQVLGTYIFVIVISSWCSDPFTDLLCLFLPFLAWSVFCLIQGWLYPPSFHFYLLGISSSILSLWAYVPLELKWVFCREHRVGPCFFSHPPTMCLLIGEFNLLTFRGDYWYVRIYYCHFIFCLLLILSLCCSFFLLFLSALISWWFSMVICSLSPFLCLCFCSRFLLVVTMKFTWNILQVK